jgi:hypothetical protein
MLWGLILAVGAPMAATAQIPIGQYVFEFAAPDDAIYEFDEISAVGEADGLTLDAQIDLSPRDAKGRYSGNAAFILAGRFTGTLVGTASASVKGKNGRGKANLKVKTSGFLLFPGIGNFPSDVDLQCKKGTIDPTGLFSGDCKGKVRIKGNGSQRFDTSIDQQLDGGVWTFTMNAVPFSLREFGGTAIDSFGDVYDLKAKYDLKKDRSKVQAKGRKNANSKGAQVRLKNFLPTGEAEATYKVRGYSGKADVQAAEDDEGEG